MEEKRKKRARTQSNGHKKNNRNEYKAAMNQVEMGMGKRQRGIQKKKRVKEEKWGQGHRK